MPAKDLFHDACRMALIKDGWNVTDDPLTLTFGIFDLFIDFGAERLIAAEKGTEKIAVEVKSFVAQSFVSEFHRAIGQFINYQTALEAEEPDRQIYLGIPLETYEQYFQNLFPRTVIERHNIKLMVYDVRSEEVVKWQD